MVSIIGLISLPRPGSSHSSDLLQGVVASGGNDSRTTALLYIIIYQVLLNVENCSLYF